VTDTIACPIDDCSETWPDTKGAGGGQRARFIHLYEDHSVRGLPFKKLF